MRHSARCRFAGELGLAVTGAGLPLVFTSCGTETGREGVKASPPGVLSGRRGERNGPLEKMNGRRYEADPAFERCAW